MFLCVCVCVCVFGAVGGGGVSECSGSPIFIKENWICAMTRHHANNVIDKKSSFF